MSRYPLTTMLAMALILPSATRAQGYKQKAILQVPGEGSGGTQQSGPKGPTTFIGSGAFAVYVSEPQDNQSFSLGTASALVWQNAAGATVQPTSGMAGTVQITFAPNNSMLQNAINKSCWGQHNCAGPGWPVVIFTQKLPGGLVTRYTLQFAAVVSITAALNGGGTGVMTFHPVYVQTMPASPQAPASQTGRAN